MTPKAVALTERLRSLPREVLSEDDEDLLEDFKDEITEVLGLLTESAAYVEADRILEPDAARYRRRDLCIRLRKYVG